MIETWQMNHLYSLNEYVVPTTRNGYVYKCTTAGYSSMSYIARYTGYSESLPIFGASYYGQSFTARSGSIPTSLKLYLWRIIHGTPGTIYVNIYNADGDGKPSGAALYSESFEGDALPASPSLRTLNLTTGDALEYGGHYVFTLSAPSGDALNCIYVRVGNYDDGLRGYYEGTMISSSDSGVSWSVEDNKDLYFLVDKDDAEEPTWPTTIEATVADNGVVWTCDHLINSIPTPKPRLNIRTYSEARLSIRNYSEPRLIIKGG